MKAVVSALVLVALSGCAHKQPPQALVSMSGSSPLDKSPTFFPKASWTLEYSWDCSGGNVTGSSATNGFAMILFNADDDSINGSQPQVTSDQPKGDGMVPYDGGGAYYLKVSSSCSWRVAVRGGR